MSIYLTDHLSKEENYEIERDVLKEAGYLGDVDTSESSEPQNSDSEDDISTKLKKGIYLALKASVFFVHAA